ncbi:hypothetical protein HPP92_004336 [Vanilla planifolia]|uniref:Protein kinase domain-containing protein n=1 Tax=Vanilla planifolia TaxID=51239 RepID=A0A835VJS9_VANPL|nr:hypothetical protein HPP92_004336 [Vanilla planifolia]
MRSLVDGVTDQADVSALNVLYGSMNSSPQLTGWTLNGGDPCGRTWKGVLCSGSAVTEIKLSGMQLTGSLGYSLNSMLSLIDLDLSDNNLGGGRMIPYNLPPNLHRLSLSSNSFSGGIPYSISLMVSLKYLNISFNSFMGDLPESFTNISSLTTLNLQNNQFTGTIDALATLPLEDLNVANNHFTGRIPNHLKGIKNLQIYGNSWDTGSEVHPTQQSHHGKRSTGGNNPSCCPSSGKKSIIGGWAIAGIVMSVLIIVSMLAFFLAKSKVVKFSREDNSKKDLSSTPLSSKEVKLVIPSQQCTSTNTEALQSANPSSLKPPTTVLKSSSDVDDKFSIMKEGATPSKAIAYSLADLQIATNSFSRDNFIGEGSIGRVYRAHLSDGKVLAVKKLNSSALAKQSSDDFFDLVLNVARLHHPHVTELVGFCSEPGQHVLIYEFHRNGSLHDRLHLLDEYNKPLSWANRVKIALGTARALEYLHEFCSPSVLHKNLKSTNILLDGDHNPHLSDCGLTAIVPALEYQALDNSLVSGYTAPEVAISGHYTMKSDVFSFGVIMLELMTGRKPFDSSRPRLEQSLIRWATPQLDDIDALDKMVDPLLEGLYSAKSLSRFASTIVLCVHPEPELRPAMSDVVQGLARLMQRSSMSKRTFSRDALESAQRYDGPTTS